MAKKTLLDTLLPRPSVEDLDKIAEQIHQASAAAMPLPRAAAQLPAKKQAEPAVAESDQHRLTIDLPRWLVNTIKTEGKKNGITVRGMILAALLEKYGQR